MKAFSLSFIKKNVFSFGPIIAVCFGISNNAVAQLDPSCKVNPKDPYEQGFRMPNGLHEGQCMDISSKRSPEIISEDKNKIVIANFRHGDRWWKAEIPKEAVDQAIFQMAKFSVLGMQAAHSQIRFVMKPGMKVKLTAQNDSEGPAKTVLLNDLVYSVEYGAPAGVPYGGVAGLTYNFQSIGIMKSTENAMKEKLGDPNGEIMQYKLKGGPELASTILETSIRNSAETGYKESYNTKSLNCTTEAFDRIDESLQKTTGKKFEPFRTGHIWDMIIGPSTKALKARALIDDSSLLPDLRDEAAAGNFLPPGIPARRGLAGQPAPAKGGKIGSGIK